MMEASSLPTFRRGQRVIPELTSRRVRLSPGLFAGPCLSPLLALRARDAAMRLPRSQEPGVSHPYVWLPGSVTPTYDWDMISSSALIISNDFNISLSNFA